MLSVYVVCWIFLQTFQTYFCKQARAAVWSRSTLFAKMTFKSQGDDKADNNYCDWQFNPSPAEPGYTLSLQTV